MEANQASIKNINSSQIQITYKNKQKHLLKVLAGNSIHVDKRFIDKYMPKFSSLLHYRLVDVSTIKELSFRWYPSNTYTESESDKTHRALDDIKNSIKELQFYRENLFK